MISSSAAPERAAFGAVDAFAYTSSAYPGQAFSAARQRCIGRNVRVSSTCNLR
jgi:hypothetical protein